MRAPDIIFSFSSLLFWPFIEKQGASVTRRKEGAINWN
jgi:hypothetical protein